MLFFRKCLNIEKRWLPVQFITATSALCRLAFSEAALCSFSSRNSKNTLALLLTRLTLFGCVFDAYCLQLHLTHFCTFRYYRYNRSEPLIASTTALSARIQTNIRMTGLGTRHSALDMRSYLVVHTNSEHCTQSGVRTRI